MAQSKRKFVKTVIQVTVLSEGFYDPENLSGVHYDITNGDCSGKWEVVKQTDLTGKQAAKELEKQGSDPAFFQLDEKGNDLEQ